MRWQTLLTEIRAQKLTLARLDPRAGMPILPPPGAAPRAIEAVERRLGRALPPSYRELLAQHDGFPALYQGAALLGARALARGTYVGLTRLSTESDALFPFGVDPSGDAIFAWDTAKAHRDGELEIVVWMNEIGDRFESFPRFLELVLDMIRSEIAERKHGVAHGVARVAPASREPAVPAPPPSSPRRARPPAPKECLDLAFRSARVEAA